jgi:hypothetical protein
MLSDAAKNLIFWLLFVIIGVAIYFVSGWMANA